MTNLYQYDSLNRLTNLLWKSTTTSLAHFSYQLGLTGNRTNLSETVSSASRNYTWQYDSLYRLTNEVVSGAAPTGTLGYRYDAVGNRLMRTNVVNGLGLATQSLTYDTNDWLMTDSYDNNGNTVNSASKPYQYDYENRLTNFNNVSGRSKPARDGRMKTSHFESGIAQRAAIAALMRDEPTLCEPATFNRHAGGQRVVVAEDRARTGH